MLKAERVADNEQSDSERTRHESVSHSLNVLDSKRNTMETVVKERIGRMARSESALMETKRPGAIPTLLAFHCAAVPALTGQLATSQSSTCQVLAIVPCSVTVVQSASAKSVLTDSYTLALGV